MVSLAGDTVAKRMAASLLSGLGRPEWVVATPEAYVEAVVRLARRCGRPGSRPSRTREKMRQSPLGDSKGLTACLEESLRGDVGKSKGGVLSETAI